MKLPSLFPVTLFAGGILLSIELKNIALPSPRFCIFTAFALLLIGHIVLRQKWIIAAVVFAAGAWLSLGLAASNLERASEAPNLARTLIESGKLDADTALRWRGRLRGDPLQLPWGMRYEIDLDHVETSAGVTPVAGGLRLTYYKEGAPTADPPAARAGDRVEVLARARPVRNYGDPGSFDFRGYLARQNIQLQGALRNGQLFTVVDHSRPTLSDRFARLHGQFLHSLDELFASRPDEGALARAMLLGDRSFVERDRVVDFQKTGVYHVLVLAGLHVGALAAFFLWAGRRLRLGRFSTILLTLLALVAYTSIVEDRPPIVRAVLMAAVYLSAKLLYRRMDIVNVAAISALAILAARPSEITDASFLLSFSAVATIGAIAVPLISRSSEPYRLALDHLSDVTRDVSHAPRVIQFRMEMRAAARMDFRAPAPRCSTSRIEPTGRTLPRQRSISGRSYSFPPSLQLGMLPPLAYYFHRVTLAGPFANVPALLLTGLAVPIGFLTLAASLVSHTLAAWLAKLLGLLLAMLDASVRWFARWHGASYRIPGPSIVLMAVFVGLGVVLSAAIRMRWRAWRPWSAAICVAGHRCPSSQRTLFRRASRLSVWN